MAMAVVVTKPRLVSADATRKHLAGIARAEVGDPEIYTEEITARTQTELLRRASRVLESGRPVILDTSFKSRETRLRARSLAEDMKARFLMIECRIPEHIARQRLQVRRGGVSDARESLLVEFLDSFEPMTELSPEEHLLLDGRSSGEQVLAELRRRGVITVDAPV